ncbi:MAG: hypothetical protein LBF37_03970 [Rickettsiales bacterium]|jgi:hypothetical protein|nr:hypothetical protein [Rickettsiales bacterium]
MKKKIFSLGLAAMAFLPVKAQRLNTDSIYNLSNEKLYAYINDAHKRPPIVEMDTVFIKSDKDIYKFDETKGFYDKNLNMITLVYYFADAHSPDFKLFSATEINDIVHAFNQEIPFRRKHEEDHAAKFSIYNYAQLTPPEIIEIELYFELSARIAEFLSHREVLARTGNLCAAFPVYSLLYKTNYIRKKYAPLFNTDNFWMAESADGLKLQKSLSKNFGNYSPYLTWLFQTKSIPPELSPDEVHAIILSELNRFKESFHLYQEQIINALLENMVNGATARIKSKINKTKDEIIKQFLTFDGLCMLDLMDQKTKQEIHNAVKNYTAAPEIKKALSKTTKQCPQYIFTKPHER